MLVPSAPGQSPILACSRSVFSLRMAVLLAALRAWEALPKMGKHWSARYVCGDFLRIELKIFNLCILYKGWQPSAGARYWRYWKILENPATSCNPMHYTATPAACKVTPSAGRTGISENSGCVGRISWATEAHKHRLTVYQCLPCSFFTM